MQHSGLRARRPHILLRVGSQARTTLGVAVADDIGGQATSLRSSVAPAHQTAAARAVSDCWSGPARWRTGYRPLPSSTTVS